MKNKRLHRLTTIIIALFLSAGARAQQVINGILRSPSGDPVPGATIRVKETNASSVSDNNGKFTINASPGNTLVISSVGFQAREVPVTGSAINETLQAA